MIGLRRRLQASVCGALLCLLLASPTASADPDPPWIDPGLAIGPYEESQRETISLFNWYLQRGNELRSATRDYRPSLSFMLYDFAYSTEGPEHQYRELAKAIAERIFFDVFSGKALLLADLKYGPEGSHPNRAMYDHLLYKTALYFLLKQRRLASAPEDVQRHGDPIQVRELRDLIEQNSGEEKLRDESFLRVVDDFLVQFETHRGAVEALTECEFAELAEGFLDGSAEIGPDAETAVLLIQIGFDRFSDRQLNIELGYLVGKYWEKLARFRQFAPAAQYIYVSAINGYPKAAYELALEYYHAGEPEIALGYLLVGSHQGHADSMALQEHIEFNYNAELSVEAQERAKRYIDKYAARACGV